MLHEYYKKKLLDEYISNDMNNIIYLLNGKNIIIETTRINDSLQRRTHSSKVEESTYRTTNVTKPMELSFKHIRAARGRSSKK